MPLLDDAIAAVNRVYREFRRYTGDGLPNAPTGAALPIGDPNSGPHSPKKSELRAMFLAVMGAAATSADDAAESLEELQRLYLGAKATDPATDNEGEPLEVGALYFNTTDGIFRVWNGVWQDQSLSLADGSVVTAKLANSAVTNAKLANMAPATVKGRVVGGEAGAPSDLTAAQLYAVLQSAAGVLHVQDRKVGGTSAGNFASGAWRTRDLNTVVVNTIPGAALDAATGQIILPAGKYIVGGAGAPAFAVNRHRTRLFNVTTGLSILTGFNEYAASPGQVQSRSALSGPIELSATSALRVEHQCEATNAAGFGLSDSIGDVNIYTDLIIARVP